jgi:hypothetical protein
MGTWEFPSLKLFFYSILKWCVQRLLLAKALIFKKKQVIHFVILFNNKEIKDVNIIQRDKYQDGLCKQLRRFGTWGIFLENHLNGDKNKNRKEKL